MGREGGREVVNVGGVRLWRGRHGSVATQTLVCSSRSSLGICPCTDGRVSDL